MAPREGLAVVAHSAPSRAATIPGNDSGSCEETAEGGFAWLPDAYGEANIRRECWPSKPRRVLVFAIRQRHRLVVTSNSDLMPFAAGLALAVLSLVVALASGSLTTSSLSLHVRQGAEKKPLGEGPLELAPPIEEDSARQ